MKLMYKEPFQYIMFHKRFSDCTYKESTHVKSKNCEFVSSEDEIIYKS